MIAIGSRTGCYARSGSSQWIRYILAYRRDRVGVSLLCEVSIRLALGKGSELNISVQYDSVGDWERICSMGQTRLGTMSVPVRIKRCDHFRLRFDGVGELRLYSIAKVITEGSDK